MNAIKVLLNRSIYEIYDKEYMDFCIDGKFINNLLFEIFPITGANGLVPAFGGWLADEEERMFASERLCPNIGEAIICPILICPDDQDLTCTTIVTEISSFANEILWSNFGFEKSYMFRNMATFGKEIDWFEKEIIMKFDKNEYINEISKFPEFNKRG